MKTKDGLAKIKLDLKNTETKLGAKLKSIVDASSRIIVLDKDILSKEDEILNLSKEISIIKNETRKLKENCDEYIKIQKEEFSKEVSDKLEAISIAKKANEAKSVLLDNENKENSRKEKELIKKAKDLAILEEVINKTKIDNWNNTDINKAKENELNLENIRLKNFSDNLDKRENKLDKKDKWIENKFKEIEDIKNKTNLQYKQVEKIVEENNKILTSTKENNILLWQKLESIKRKEIEANNKIEEILKREKQLAIKEKTVSNKEKVLVWKELDFDSKLYDFNIAHKKYILEHKKANYEGNC